MPKNKNASIRYRILNECFQNDFHMPSTSNNQEFRGCWSKQELLEVIEERLGVPINEKTLMNDIRELREEYGAPIKNFRSIGWRYNEPFSITENPLNEDDYKVLNEIVEILKNYSGFKYFEDADTIISKIEENRLHTDFAKIQLDTLPSYTGLQFVSVLKDAIFSKKTLKLSYKEFELDKVELIFHPYILKEYNNRWFVLGYAEQNKDAFGKLWLFALDRIMNAKKCDKKYKSPDKKELKLYFSNIYGVTNYKKNRIEKVIIRIGKFRSNYFKTKPIHKSQILIKEELDYDYYSLELKLNNEIISLFLSFGKDLEVLEPESFKKEIMSQVKELYRHYY